MGRLGTSKGQDLVESALILPVLMLFMLGIMEFGIAVFAYDTVANAAREGARFGIVHPDDNVGIELAALGLTTGLDPGALQVGITRLGTTIEVEVIYQHNFVTGIIIGAVGGDPSLEMRAVATMQTEQ